jgi:hypothetical protein
MKIEKIFLVFYFLSFFEHTYQNFLKISSGMILQDCQCISLEFNILKATCLKDNSLQDIVLDLDQCITNLNGKLLWTDSSVGVFSRHCKSCTLKDTIMTCLCSKADRSGNVLSSIDLKNGVDYVQGELICKNM